MSIIIGDSELSPSLPHPPSISTPPSPSLLLPHITLVGASFYGIIKMNVMQSMRTLGRKARNVGSALENCTWEVVVLIVSCEQTYKADSAIAPNVPPCIPSSLKSS